MTFSDLLIFIYPILHFSPLSFFLSGASDHKPAATASRPHREGHPHKEGMTPDHHATSAKFWKQACSLIVS